MGAPQERCMLKATDNIAGNIMVTARKSSARNLKGRFRD